MNLTNDTWKKIKKFEQYLKRLIGSSSCNIDSQIWIKHPCKDMLKSEDRASSRSSNKTEELPANIEEGIRI
jgi:hypothetical protein